MVNSYDNIEWMGQKYGHLTIFGYDRKRDGGFRCVCECGNIVSVRPSKLIKGDVLTCGKCELRWKTQIHGISTLGLRLSTIWRGMNNRCYSPINHAYKYYGGRGITVCDEWRTNELSFIKWALSNGYSNNLTIDRINPNGNYEPENCRWATYKEQRANQNPCYTFTAKPKVKRQNKRKIIWTIDGVTKSGIDWCNENNISLATVLYRINTKNLTPKEALSMPLHPNGRRRKEVL